MWRETCRYLRQWRDKGYAPLPASVNISRYDVFRADLIDVILGLVREFDIPIDLLHLEITESAFAQSTPLVVEIVKKLIGLGFVIEIDDFGSGYSSLNTLKSVPAHVVKLDMRFLQDAGASPRGGNILESVVRMTKWLGMSIIAEGVETQAQGDFLKSIGCNHVQGYLYARPMPASDYEIRLKSAEKEEIPPVLETVESLDNDAFWNPNSIDSLIFNSYVGSACIYEFTGDKIELLRATDKYAQMLGGGMTVDALLKLNLAEYLDAASAAKTFAQLRASAGKSGEVTVELLFRNLPGCPCETFVRSTMRIIARTGERCLVYCLSENITAQRLSERKERKAAKQLQSILDNINCGVTATAVSGGVTEYLLANNRYFELLGYTREQYDQAIGRRTFDAVFAEDRAHVAAVVERVWETGAPASMEYRALRRDGSVVWLRSFLSMTVFEDVAGQVQLCTYADITAEKHTAQNLLDNLPCGAGICVVTENGARMTYLNKRYFSYFQHNVAEHQTSSVFDAIHPDDRSILRKAMLPALTKGGEGTCVVRILAGPGEYLPFRLSGVAIDSEDNDHAIYVTFVPVSYEALSLNEVLPVVLERMMASSTDLSFVKDVNLRYICCSRAFARMVGLESEKDIVGKSDYDLFDKRLADHYVADDRSLMKSGVSIIDMVEDIPATDGKARYSSTSKYLLYGPSGNLLGLYGSGHDITQTREAEARQKFLINNIPGGVAVYEGQWSTLESINLAYFSDGFCRLFGYTREEYAKLGDKNPTSLVTQEYVAGLVRQIEALVQSGAPIDYVYRARVKDGGYRWIYIKAVLGERHDDNMTVNAVLFDVTEYQETLERLRVSEEENRLAIQHSNNIVCRYDVATKTLRASSNTNPIFEIPATVGDIPYGQVRDGRISPETADAYIALYESILKGEKSGGAVYQRKAITGWRWIKAHFSTIFSSDGAPVSAVLSFFDVTDSFERDVTYQKWMQSLHTKARESYSLFRCNISKDTVFDTSEGELLHIRFKPGPFNFDQHTEEYAAAYVCEEDAESFRALLNIDALLERYRRKERTVTLDYREKLPQGGYRWLRLTVDLVESPHTTKAEAYLLFENIDDAKRAELLTLERAETDPLTGLFNRATFERKVNERLREAAPGVLHALLMLDLDGFKLVNDAFGHGAGDQTLTDVANLLRAVTRGTDWVGRLGGDEFVVFVSDLPSESIATRLAKQICELSRKTFNAEVQISASVGIAVFPRDGTDFETLYKKADETLYYVKGMGKDNFAFYRDDIKNASLRPNEDGRESAVRRLGEKKRRMLIVDDSPMDRELLSNLFQNDFLIEKAQDGNAALIRLRHYGSAISIVLLDLLMPGMDGFAVLAKMRQSPEMQSIPVVAVSGADDSETSLRAIRGGASDFVTKPVDADVLRIRVESAISRAENEKKRAINSRLELRSDETLRYKAVLEKMGLAVVGLDWGKGAFTYDPALSKLLAGSYDGRPLWRILMSDFVADPETVRTLQQFVHDVAEDKSRTEGRFSALLKTPDGKTRPFDIRVYKLENEYGLADKMILTFQAAEDPRTAKEKEGAPAPNLV